MTLIFKRNTLGLLIGSYYLPTGVFAILSNISYFIRPDIVSGRMGLLLILLLISSNVYNCLNAPNSRGISYIEIWLLGAQGTILGAIFEYGIILAWKHHSKKLGTENLDEKIKILGINFKKKIQLCGEDFLFLSLFIFSDTVSFIISCLFWLFFNIHYWTIWTT